MSIQEASRKKLGRRLIKKLHIARLVRFPALSKEKWHRKINSNPLKVYLRYQHLSIDNHPWIDRYYRYPPLHYCNFKKARLYHWIFSPDLLDEKPFIVEPNDHPFSAVGVLTPVPTEPADVLRNYRKAVERVYLNPLCKRILVESRGQWELFERYCPEVLTKCEIVKGGTIPREQVTFGIPGEQEQINFLCLASDFVRKAVDLLMDAWLDFPDRGKHRLIIACPDIPEKYRTKVRHENVTLILKAPLSFAEKDSLYRKSHVAVGPLHIDGGGNMMEAMEYGLPLITMRSQRSVDQVMNDNGTVVDAPFYFYDEGYGKQWPTWNDFFRILDKAKMQGKFDITKEGFIKAFNFFIHNREKIPEMGKGSYALACHQYSLKLRNERLLKLYESILSN